jgi:phospholipid/cholesterol/gamma-HCH transport system substrate-binding protein
LGNYELGETGGYTLSALFDTAAGINDETPVLLAGLRVGMVTDMRLEGGRARVYFKIKSSARIPRDSQITVASRGFLGARYLEIAPGRSGESYRDGESIANSGMAGELSALSAKAGDVADDLKAITANLRKVLGGEEGEEGMRDVFLNLQEITSRLAGALADNQQRMNQIAANIERVTAGMAAMTEENRKAVHDAVAAMPAIARNLQVLSGNLANLTESNNEELNKAVKELAASSERLREAMTSIASIAGKIDNGQGSIGRLVNDSETIDKVSDSIDTLNEYLGRIRRIQTTLGYRGEYFPEDADLKSYISLRLQPQFDQWYEVQVVDDPFDRTVTSKTVETTTYDKGGPTERQEKKVTERAYTADQLRFSAWVAKRWYFFVARGGLIENHAGVGAETWFFDDHLNLFLEASDFANENNPRLKAGMDFLFLDHFFVTAGGDDLVHRDVLAGDAYVRWFLGGGIRFTDEDITALISRLPSVSY